MTPSRLCAVCPVSSTSTSTPSLRTSAASSRSGSAVTSRQVPPPSSTAFLSSSVFASAYASTMVGHTKVSTAMGHQHSVGG